MRPIIYIKVKSIFNIFLKYSIISVDNFLVLKLFNTSALLGPIFSPFATYYGKIVG